jgi:hypothetical protein
MPPKKTASAPAKTVSRPPAKRAAAEPKLKQTIDKPKAPSKSYKKAAAAKKDAPKQAVAVPQP